MPHSLYRKLHRRYGPKLSGAARFARARDKQAEFTGWLRTATQMDCGNALPRGVAVVGAGFSGLAAAWTLAQFGVRATVFEARSVYGGRVESDRKLIPGRVIEAGAELIGLNHPMWLSLARQFGLGLTVLTSEDQYAGAGLEMPLRIKGGSVANRDKLYEQMTFVFRKISNDAKVIKDPFAPWTAPGAAALDGKSVADKIADFVRLLPAGTRHPNLVDAIELQLGNDNVFPTKEQSYLGLLALVAGGRFGAADVDLDGYWTTTEDFRCSEGNDRLAVMMLELGRFKAQTSAPVVKIEIVEASHAKVTWLDVGRGTLASQDFDFVILTAPPNVWKKIAITPPLPPGMEMAMGPAVKYLSRVSDRFWVKRGLAPSGLADDIGQTWEGTENQTLASQGIELTAFAGGVNVPKVDGAKHFRTRLPTLYPGFAPVAERYADWPGVPFIETGNVCPKVGQVTTIAKFLSTPHKSRLFFAGEHACMAFFGYMEGALQSGARAAKAVLSRCVPRQAQASKAPRERLRHEYQRPEAIEAAWLPRAAGGESQQYVRWPWPSPIPMESEEDEPDASSSVPSGLVALSHSHVERTCKDGKTFSSAASASPMSPKTMNPGFIKADDTLIFDTALDAKLVRLILDTPKYAAMLSAESRKTRTPHKEDRLRVALVDLTGDKICKPGLAAWGSTLAMPGGSTAKVLIVYAAHQLIFDLNELARSKTLKTAAALSAQADAEWKALICKPDLKWLVDIDDRGATASVRASATLTKHLNEMVTRSFSGVSTTRASELIMRLGFEYLASVAFQSGLRHPTRGGVWFGNTYLNATVTAPRSKVCHSGNNPIVWAKNPLGATGITLTALSAATFMTLLAQARLVNGSASAGIEALLKGGCGFVSIAGVTRRATKCGLTNSVRHDAVLLEGPGRRYALSYLTTNPSWAARNEFIADLDRLIKANNP